MILVMGAGPINHDARPWLSRVWNNVSFSLFLQDWSPRVRVNFVVVLLAVLISTTLCIYLSKEASFLRAGTLRVVTGQNSDKTLADLWISPAGVVTAVFEHNLSLSITSWPLEHKESPVVQIVPFARLLNIGDSTRIALHSPRASLWAETAAFAPESNRLPYAVSPHEPLVAWHFAGVLTLARVQDLQSPGGLDLARHRNVRVKYPIQALSFLGNSRLVVILADTLPRISRIRIWRTDRASLVQEGADFILPAQNWALVADGPTLVVGNPAEGYWRLSLAQRHYQGYPPIYEPTTFAATDAEEVLVGTRQGAVVALSSSSPGIAVSGEVIPSPISALFRYDPRTVIAAGENGGLYSIRDMRQIVRLAQTPAGVRLLAVGNRQVALGTRRTLWFLELRHWPPTLTTTGGLLWAVMAFLGNNILGSVG